MSAAMSIWAALVVGVFVFVLMVKYLRRITYALMGSILCAILVYVAMPSMVPMEKDSLNKTSKKTLKGLEILKGNPEGGFKSLGDIRKNLGDSEKAMRDRVQDVDDATQ